MHVAAFLALLTIAMLGSRRCASSSISAATSGRASAPGPSSGSDRRAAMEFSQPAARSPNPGRKVGPLARPGVEDHPRRGPVGAESAPRFPVSRKSSSDPSGRLSRPRRGAAAADTIDTLLRPRRHRAVTFAP